MLKSKLILSLIAFFMTFVAQAQEANGRYIEVTGTAEIEIVPDTIHYIIEIREYFTEEFDGKSKPEEYRHKVSLPKIEERLRKVLDKMNVPERAVRTQEVGNYWRQPGQDFLVSKKFDITLTDFTQVNEIAKRVDTRGINSMYIGELKNKDILRYHRQGKIEALKAAQQKAEYMVEALGKRLGGVLRIVENPGNGRVAFPQSNVMSSDAQAFDSFRTIKQDYSVLVRFEILD